MQQTLSQGTVMSIPLLQNQATQHARRLSTRSIRQSAFAKTVSTLRAAIWLGAGLTLTTTIERMPVAQAQEFEAATGSRLAGVALPSGAMRVKAKDVPAEISQALKNIIQSAGSHVKQGQNEIIAWAGNGYKKSRVPQIKSQVSNSLKKAGWEYEETVDKEAAPLILVTAIRSTPTRKAMIGYWVPTDEALLLAWTEMLPSGNSAPATSDDPSTQASNTEQGSSTEEAASTDEDQATPAAQTVASGGSSATPLSGIKLPQGPTRMSGLSDNFAGLLNALADDLKLGSGQGEAEVFMWSGGSFKPERARFTRTAVESALTSAGYTVKQIDNNQIRGTNPFTKEYGLEESRVALSLTDQISYFWATSTQRQQSLVGVWIQGESRLALGVMPIEFKAPHQSAPPPAVGGANVVLVKDTNDAMKGIAPPPNPTFPALARKPGFARGYAKFADGKPIVGANIILWVSAAGGFRTDVKGKTNAQGLYEIPLSIGICEIVNADCKVTYNGATYVLPLHPVDGEFDQFNSTTGGIDHLTLRTYGPGKDADTSPKFGENYYGGHLRTVYSGMGQGGTIEIKLTPQGPLLGGVKGRTLVFRFPNGASENYLNDVPLGRYTLTARLLDDGEALPIRVNKLFGGEPSSSVQVDFESNGGNLASLGRSGVRRFDVQMQP